MGKKPVRQEDSARVFRDVRIASHEVRFSYEGDVIRVTPLPELPAYPERITDRLEHWAQTAPERTFLARRRPDGQWRAVSYRQALDRVRRLGQAILDRGLSAERPILILSGNGIDHALLGLAALYVGVPFAPISPAYSLLSRDYGKLRHVVSLTTPGLVFAEDGAAFADAIAAAVPADTERVLSERAETVPGGRPFAELAAGISTPAVDRAHAAVTGDTIAKLLFTSGSTGMPKGVINTQRMLCSNQIMLNNVFEFLRDEPPVLVDWLPWNHTFGGNHNLGIVLFNGGTLHIDDGRPVPGGMDDTLRNLREIAPSVYFNVPKGFEILVSHLRADAALRETFFSRLQMMFFAGAGLAQHIWDALDDMAIETVGGRVPMLTGLGATETAPFALVVDKEEARSGVVGLPVPGVEFKAVPVAGKLEARVRGPNVTPGYWRQADLTRKVFDEEGFYRLGDAVRFVSADEPYRGFAFDGRIAEDFKLSSGTWVSVGTLRARIIDVFAPLVQDVVITGHDGNFVGALVFPDLAACRELCPDLDQAVPDARILTDKRVRHAFRERLAALNAQSTGSSTRVSRMLVLDSQPSLDAGEVTDKGTVNQRAVIEHRAADVAELHADPPRERVIDLDSGS